jgi:hypothetical protein
VHYDAAKAQSSIVQIFCTTGDQSLLSLWNTNKKKFYLYFKQYNLIIRVINFFEFFCICSSSSLEQNPIIKIPNFYFFLFLLFELETVDLSILLKKMTFVLYGLNMETYSKNISENFSPFFLDKYKCGRGLGPR